MTLQQEAIDFIQAHEPPEGYFVGFSGGKDSIVTLDLVRQSKVKHQAYYNMTLIDPPEVVRFIRQYYPDVICLKPDFTFWQGCLKKNMPIRMGRWCCEYLKHSTKSVKAIPTHYQTICGIRAEESPRRAKRGRISYNPNTKTTVYSPIFWWSSAELWDYIHFYELSYPSLYDEGFHRLGCVVCPFIGKKSLELHKKRWPNIYRILDIYLNKLWERDKEKLEARYFTYEEFMKWPVWKTKEERKQGVLNGTH